MRGVNKVILVGKIGRDPEVKQLHTGKLVNLSLATSEQWRDKVTNEKKEKTEWHKLVIFGKLAEIAEQYVVKGAKLYVEGSLNTKEWLDKQGIKHYTTQVNVTDFQMLNDAKTGVKSSQNQDKQWQESYDDDIAF